MLQISQKTFLLGGLALLFVVSSGLFMYHNRALDPKQTGDWWAVRFVSLQDDKSLVFEVENYSPATEGTYQVFVNDALQEEKIFSILLNSVTTVTPATLSTDSVRSRIVVKLGDKEQSLIR